MFRGGIGIKNVGIVRHIDHLGRLVIPKEIRETLDIGDMEKMEIRAFEDYIEIRKAKEILSRIDLLLSKYAKLLCAVTRNTVVIVDFERILFVSDGVNPSYFGSPISKDMKRVLKQCHTITRKRSIVLLTDNYFLPTSFYLIPLWDNEVRSAFVIVLRDKEEISKKLILFFAKVINF